MTKINENNDNLRWIYKIGFFIILALPILVWPPYFFPADWGKSIIFRGVLAILLFLFLGKILYRKIEVPFDQINKNKTVWILRALLAIYLLASIFSVDPNFSFWGSPYRGGGFVSFGFFFVLTALSFILLKKEDWKRTWIFSIFIGLLVSLIALTQYYGLFLVEQSRPASTMGNADILATYLLLLSFLTLSFAIKEPFNTAQGKAKKAFYGLSLLIFIYTILITESRAAYLGLAVASLYFFLAYPKKIKTVKIAAVSLLVLAAGFIFYVNTVNQYPKFLQQNKLFTSVSSRLSLNLFLIDPRFYAWSKIDYKILINKPVLGYGPENFAVGFDKYYDPSVPYLSIAWGDWYDKAHDIIIQTGSDAGILGIAAYLALFIYLFWKLQKTKRINDNNKTIIIGIQATMIGYFINNIFSFDTFSTYLIFFLLAAYSMHLIFGDMQETIILSETQKNIPGKFALISTLFCLLVIFLWQYNLVPLQVNAEINKAGTLSNQKKCDQAFALMDKALSQHSFLDSYVIMKYIDIEKTCTNYYPDNTLAYTKKGIELLKEGVKIQPLYTRYWIYLGTLTTTLAEQENDQTKKDNILNRANGYLYEALQLAPKHQEILIAKAKVQMDEKNYQDAKDESEKCILANPGQSDCYWYLGLSEMYLKNNTDADKNIQIATTKGYDVSSETSLVELGNVYNSLNDYKNLAVVFEKLTVVNPDAVQYHSSLATVYAKLGEYDKAKQEALKVLKISPGSKQNVDAFLETLPE